MKKAVLLALALTCVFSLSACRDTGADKDDTTIDGVIEDTKEDLEDKDKVDSGTVTDDGNGEGLITDHDGSLNLDDDRDNNNQNTGKDEASKKSTNRTVR